MFAKGLCFFFFRRVGGREERFCFGLKVMSRFFQICCFLRTKISTRTAEQHSREGKNGGQVDFSGVMLILTFL